MNISDQDQPFAYKLHGIYFRYTITIYVCMYVYIAPNGSFSHMSSSWRASHSESYL